MSEMYGISEDSYGVQLDIYDRELGDEFEDFLNQKCYVFFDVGFPEAGMSFHFGQAGCAEKVKQLVESFLKKSEA